jgi:hypothetical protein
MRESFRHDVTFSQTKRIGILQHILRGVHWHSGGEMSSRQALVRDIAASILAARQRGGVVYLPNADKYNGPVAYPLRVVNQPVMSPPIGVSGPRPAVFACQ